MTFGSMSIGNATCGLTRRGAAWCWGFNGNGEVGDSTNEPRLSPVAVRGGHSFIAIYAARGETCGLTAAHAAWCWGYIPKAVAVGHGFNSLAPSSFHQCGLTATGAAWCWGSNAFGRLGNGKDSASKVPVAVAGGLLFSALAAGPDAHTCGITKQSLVFCWGRNSWGQLGDGSTDDRNAPVPLSPPRALATPSTAKEAPEITALRQRAEKGNAEAQFSLGLAFLGGTGVGRDFVEAASWFRKAAEQGHPKAQYKMAVLSSNGWGMPRDYEQAAGWLRKAAAQGDVAAEGDLGAYYQTGTGVAKDPVAAMNWYRKAADQGDANARHNVGVLYLNGEGVLANPAEALKWVDLALASDPGNETYLRTRKIILQRLKADSAAGR
jgi:hypothetical protein